MLRDCLRNYTHLFGLNNCDWSLELKVLFKRLVHYYVFALVTDLLLQLKVTFPHEVSPNVSLNPYQIWNQLRWEFTQIHFLNVLKTSLLLSELLKDKLFYFKSSNNSSGFRKFRLLGFSHPFFLFQQKYILKELLD